MRTLIDREGIRVFWTSVDGTKYVLEGSCLKCGTCCYRARPKCKHLVRELWDGAEVRICKDYWNRPWFCAYYPFNPKESLPSSCGFAWRLSLDD